MSELKAYQLEETRSDRNLTFYLGEIGAIELLTPEEEVELARAAQNGDLRALDKLVSANTRFVVTIAKQYQNQGLELADLIAEGNLGLMKAARRFDESKEFKFISYAVWWIRQVIREALAENSRLVRVPELKRLHISRWKKLLDRIYRIEGRRATYLDAVAHFGWSASYACEIEGLFYLREAVSLDGSAFRGGDDEKTMHEVVDAGVEADFDAYQGALAEDVRAELANLPGREGYVLAKYFGIDCGRTHTLQEIGKELGLTRERVRQIKERAIRRLAHPSHRKLREWQNKFSTFP